MLVLGCQQDDGVKITSANGKVLRVVVLRSQPGKVRLGFDDPEQNFKILRENIPKERQS